MTMGQRFLVTIFIVLAALFGLSLCGYNYWEPQPQQQTLGGFMLESAMSEPVELPLCMDEATREQVKSVMLDALDHELQQHIDNVFLIWLRYDRGQPGRARTGVQQGVKAYLSARCGVADWGPP